MCKVKIMVLVVVSLFLSAYKGCQYPAFLSQTGQVTPYATGDDGDTRRGVPLPEPRFKDNQDGTVTDYLTGLVWARNADCLETLTWDEALFECSQLADGDCGLSDGSSAGDWSLPNRNELLSLVNYEYDPAVSNTEGTGQWTQGDPFFNVQRETPYWTSTTWGGDSDIALPVWFGVGGILNKKTESKYVWCVKVK